MFTSTFKPNRKNRAILLSCSALREFTKNGCSCNADVTAEAARLGFSSTMLLATARVAQVACGRGTVWNSCDQSFGC